eukprot:gene2136-2424_t
MSRRDKDNNVDELKKTLGELKRTIQSVEKQLHDDSGESHRGSKTASRTPSPTSSDRALSNFRSSFPALASRNYNHKENRKMLQAVVPYPIRETWTHDFCCIPFPSQNTTPSAAQTEALNKAGLGRTKIVFGSKFAKHADVCKKLEETFPKLKAVGGYIFLRVKTGGQNRPLSALGCKWYNVADLRKEVSGTAFIYIRPIQSNLDLQPSTRMHTELNAGPTATCLKCGKEVGVELFKDHRCSVATSTSRNDFEVIDLVTENDNILAQALAASDFDPDELVNTDFMSDVSEHSETPSERKLLIEAQNDAYGASLAADKKKATNFFSVDSLIQSNTESKREVEELEEMDAHTFSHFRESCKRKLPEEPTDENDVVPLRFRLPSGETICRRFKNTCDVEVVVNFIGSQANSTPCFRMQSPTTPTIKSDQKRTSLADVGVAVPCTFNVVWDGTDFPVDQQTNSEVEASSSSVANDSSSDEIMKASLSCISNDVLKITIRRTFIVEDMIKTFSDLNILDKRLEMQAVNERGQVEQADDFGGVYRDILTAFWSELLNRLFTGETEMLPHIRHDVEDTNGNLFAAFF